MPSRVTVLAREVRLRRVPDLQLTVDDFEVYEHRVTTLPPGHFVVRNDWLSVDASTMLRLGGDSGSYLPPIRPHTPIEGWAVGRVVHSDSTSFRLGDRVLHNHGWRDHTVLDGALTGWGSAELLPPDGRRDDLYLGALGPTGLTAWAGLLRVAQLRRDDVVLVSAAAGAVGSLVVQLARQRGHRVIASAGSAAKVEYLRGLGVHSALNYRDAPIAEQLRHAAPDGIDVYFDNVGGDHLEAALDALRPGGRVALCGAVSSYGPGVTPTGPRNLFNATAKGLTLRGYLARMFAADYGRCRRDMRELALPTFVTQGLDRAPQALLDLMAGRSTGKVLVELGGRAASPGVG